MYKQLNTLLSKYFGVGIFLALILGFKFQYAAVSLTPYGIFILFLLMFLSGFTIDVQQIRQNFSGFKALTVANLLIFIISPIVVMIFAKILLDDDQYIYGAVFSSLTPAAAVAPFFTGHYKSDKNSSFLFLISSMVLAPILIPLILTVLLGNSISIPGILLFKDILILVPLPIALSMLVKKFLPIVFEFIRDSLPILNFFLLAVLFFIQFGSSVKKLPLNHIDTQSILFIFLIAIIQDFYLFLFLKPISDLFKDQKMGLAVVLAGSMKNIAIASTILLLYNPKAAIVPAIGFITHSVLFTPLIVSKIIKKTSE